MINKYKSSPMFHAAAFVIAFVILTILFSYAAYVIISNKVSEREEEIRNIADTLNIQSEIGFIRKLSDNVYILTIKDQDQDSICYTDVMFYFGDAKEISKSCISR